LAGLFLWLVLLGLPVSPGFANDWKKTFNNDPASRRVFHEGVQDYRNGDYGHAEWKFRSLLPALNADDEEAVALFIGKCLLAQKLYPEAESWLDVCRDNYTGGLYEDAILYLSGHAAYYMSDPARAAEFYLQAYAVSRDARLRRLVVFSLSPLFARWLDDAGMRELADDIPEGPIAVEFHYRWGRRHESRGRLSLAKQNYRDALRRGRDGTLYQEIRERLDQLRRRQKQTTRIGLLYPATGPLSEFGVLMKNAAQLAVEAWRKDHGGLIEIIAEDTRGDPLQASAAARWLVEEGVSAVVGPLTSASAVAVANILSCTGTAHVLPVASQQGLTSLSSHLYQLSCTPTTVGETLARYAVEQQADSTFAVIAPDDSYGHEISRAFQKTAVQKSAIVFPIQYSEPGRTDHRRELMRLKRIILRELYDSTVFYTVDGDTLDEEQVPVHIGGILLPGDADDLNAILPQLRFYNIFADYLGTDGWAHPDRLSRSQEFLEGAVFASPEYHNPHNYRWADMLSKWQRQYAGEPDIVATRTFDAVMFAAMLLTKSQRSSGPTTTASLFEGASGTIKFSAGRENGSVPLYGYHNGQILPVDEIPRPAIDPESTND
jgi:ABC-type branched-subunit amino acid transport system substrate-binding protein